MKDILNKELNEELSYSKYDYCNKDTDNSWSGHSSKIVIPVYGDMESVVLRERNGGYEPRLVKKYQNTVTQNMKEKILFMYEKGMTTGDIESHIILIDCADGMTGFPLAIEAIYSQTEIQQYIIRRIRNTPEFISCKDIKKLMADLKLVYVIPAGKLR